MPTVQVVEIICRLKNFVHDAAALWSKNQAVPVERVIILSETAAIIALNAVKFFRLKSVLARLISNLSRPLKRGRFSIICNY